MIWRAIKDWLRVMLRRGGIPNDKREAEVIAAVMEPVALRFHWRPQLKDPGDEMVLETAVNGHADRLATFNVRHLREAAMVFGIRASCPGEVWREIRGAKHEEK